MAAPSAMSSEEQDRWIAVSLQRNGDLGPQGAASAVVGGGTPTASRGTAAMSSADQQQQVMRDASRRSGWKIIPMFVDPEAELLFIEHYTQEKIVAGTALLVAVCAFLLVAMFFIELPGVGLYSYSIAACMLAFTIAFFVSWWLLRYESRNQALMHEAIIGAFVLLTNASVWILGKPREIECLGYGRPDPVVDPIRVNRSNFYCINTIGTFHFLIMFGTLLWVRQRLLRVIVSSTTSLLSWHAGTIAFGANSLEVEILVTAMIVVSLGVICFFSRELEIMARRQFSLRAATKSQQAALRLQVAEIERILMYFMPDSLLYRLQEAAKSQEANALLIADVHYDVSIVFADIVDFTQLCNSLHPKVIATFLTEFYGRLDYLSVECGVLKIKTIGDAYNAVCGIPAPEQDHADRAAVFAFGVLHQLRQVDSIDAEQMQIRIGINTGAVVGGIVSSTQIVYDIFGEASQLAKAACELAEPNEIIVTEHTLPFLGRRLFRWSELLNVHGTSAELASSSTLPRLYQLFPLQQASSSEGPSPLRTQNAHGAAVPEAAAEAAEEVVVPLLSSGSRAPSIDSQQPDNIASIMFHGSGLPSSASSRLSGDADQTARPGSDSTQPAAPQARRVQRSGASSVNVSLSHILMRSTMSRSFLPPELELESVADSALTLEAANVAVHGAAGLSPAERHVLVPQLFGEPSLEDDEACDGERAQLLEGEGITIQQRFNIFRWINSVGGGAGVEAASPGTADAGGPFVPMPSAPPSEIGISPSELASNWDGVEMEDRHDREEMRMRRQEAREQALRCTVPFLSFTDGQLEAQFWSEVRLSDARSQILSRCGLVFVLAIIVLLDGVHDYDYQLFSTFGLLAVTLLIACISAAHYRVGPGRSVAQLVCDILVLVCLTGYLIFMGFKKYSIFGKDTLYLRIIVGSFAPFVASRYHAFVVCTADAVFIVTPAAYFTIMREEYLPATISSILFSSFFMYASLFSLERQRRLELLDSIAMQAATRQAEVDHRVQRKLLESLLPRFIVPSVMQHLRSGNRQRATLAETLEGVSVMFAELGRKIIHDSGTPSVEVLQHIREELAVFDRLITVHPLLVKIKNIGDLVVVCGPIDKQSREQAVSEDEIVRTANESMLTLGLQLKCAISSALIALHVGRVNIAVIGAASIQLDVFGDVLNTCSRISDAGRLPSLNPDVVNCSLTFWRFSPRNLKGSEPIAAERAGEALASAGAREVSSATTVKDPAIAAAANELPSAQNPLVPLCATATNSESSQPTCSVVSDGPLQHQRTRHRNARLVQRLSSVDALLSVGAACVSGEFVVKQIVSVELRGKYAPIILVGVTPG